MHYGVLSVVPILVLIIGSLITKKITEMMVIASVTGAILVFRWQFFSGYISMMYAVLSSTTFQFILIVFMCFGAVVRQFQKSGAFLGFRSRMERLSGRRSQPIVLAWFLLLLLFIDDYLNILAVSFAMRDITDDSGVPREHLAFQVSSVSASLSILVPFTSWTAFTIGLLNEQGLGFGEYVRAIPFMFFPWIILILTLLLALGYFPRVGLLKESYERIRSGGEILVKEPETTQLLEMEVDLEHRESSVWNFIIPIAVLMAVVFLYGISLVHGLIAALVCQGILYISQGLMTAEEFVDNFFEGTASMSRLAIIIFFAYVLNEANTAMGFSEYLIGLAGPGFPAFLLPLIVFLLISLTTFAGSGCWVIQVITIPVFVPLAASTGVNVSLIIAALMSGVVFGSVLCFYSDVVFMTYAGTGVPNMRQIRVAAPYSLGVAAVTGLLYLLVGLLM